MERYLRAALYSLVFLVFVTSLPAIAQVAAIPSGTASGFSLWIPVIAGIVSGLITLAGIGLKDYIFKILEEGRQETKNQQEIFRNYAAPLAASCEKLVWRLGEIFIERRHKFLLKKTLPLVFNEYKRKSTLYRIATLLGWIRAINIELSSLTDGVKGSKGYFSDSADAIGSIQRALADGPHVEVHRLEQICKVWNIELTAAQQEKIQHIAGNFEVALYEHAGEDLKEDSNYLIEADREKQKEICLNLASYLCAELGRKSIPEAIIEENLKTAISKLSYREALIYRDWQDAIGDAVLAVDPDSARMYKIIGYDQFDEVLSGKSLWISIFRESIVDIDFDRIDPNDFRAKQLEDLAIGVAKLLKSLASVERGIFVNDAALSAANRILESISKKNEQNSINGVAK